MIARPTVNCGRSSLKIWPEALGGVVLVVSVPFDMVNLFNYKGLNCALNQNGKYQKKYVSHSFSAYWLFLNGTYNLCDGFVINRAILGAHLKSGAGHGFLVDMVGPQAHAHLAHPERKLQHHPVDCCKGRVVVGLRYVDVVRVHNVERLRRVGVVCFRQFTTKSFYISMLHDGVDDYLRETGVQGGVAAAVVGLGVLQFLAHDV